MGIDGLLVVAEILLLAHILSVCREVYLFLKPAGAEIADIGGCVRKEKTGIIYDFNDVMNLVEQLQETSPSTLHLLLVFSGKRNCRALLRSWYGQVLKDNSPAFAHCRCHSPVDLLLGYVQAVSVAASRLSEPRRALSNAAAGVASSAENGSIFRFRRQEVRTQLTCSNYPSYHN